MSPDVMQLTLQEPSSILNPEAPGMKSSTINVRVDPKLKEDAMSVLNKMGMPLSNAIELFLHEVVFYQGIPFMVTALEGKPSKKLLKALKEAEVLRKQEDGPYLTADDDVIKKILESKD